jgi:hypothetical protein
LNLKNKIMSRIFTFLFCLLLSFCFYAQENPWVQSKGENPWVAKDTSQIIVLKTDSLQQRYFERGYESIDAYGGLGFGFATTAIANVFGVVPSLFSLAVPSYNERNAAEILSTDEVKPTEEQVKKYKKGVLKKRTQSTFKGVALGVAANTLIIIIIIFN